MDDKAEILSLWRSGMKPGKIYRRTGVPVPQICQIISEANRTPTVSVKPQRHGGFGREELRRHLISRRTSWTSWDNPAAVEQARRDYDAGLHEMCQGRDGDFFLLYSIPRRIPCKPRTYFSEPAL